MSSSSKKHDNSQTMTFGGHLEVMRRMLFRVLAVTTAIGVVKSDSGVQKVTYYNTAGVSSSTPFDGLNVVVTVKADGTRQVTKMVK